MTRKVEDQRWKVIEALNRCETILFEIDIRTDPLQESALEKISDSLRDAIEIFKVHPPAEKQ